MTLLDEKEPAIQKPASTMVLDGCWIVTTSREQCWGVTHRQVDMFAQSGSRRHDQIAGTP